MDTDGSKSLPPQPNSTVYDQEDQPNVDPTADCNENPTQQQPNLPRQQSSRRTSFTNLSQIDADLELPRTLQEQEEIVYMILRLNHDESDYGSWEEGSYFHGDDDDEEDDDFDDPDDESDEEEGLHEHEFDEKRTDDEEDGEDVFDFHAWRNTLINLDDDDDDDGDGDGDGDGDEDEEEEDAEVEFDPGVYSSDEEEDEEEEFDQGVYSSDEETEERFFGFGRINHGRAIAVGNHDRGFTSFALENHDRGFNFQELLYIWEEDYPDELSYEEVIALAEVVGTVSRGLSADAIASLRSVNYTTSNQNGSNDSCVICLLDYEDGENLTMLSCKHSFHKECINDWLRIKKICPYCRAEVSTSGNS